MEHRSVLGKFSRIKILVERKVGLQSEVLCSKLFSPLVMGNKRKIRGLQQGVDVWGGGIVQ